MCDACDRCKPEEVALDAAPASSSAAPKRGAPAKKKPSRAEADADEAMDADPVLMRKLRALRSTLATKKRVPPYRIFHDRTMVDLASKKPASRASLLEVYGLGEAKVDQFGDAILRLLASS